MKALEKRKDGRGLHATDANPNAVRRQTWLLAGSSPLALAAKQSSSICDGCRRRPALAREGRQNNAKTCTGRVGARQATYCLTDTDSDLTCLARVLLDPCQQGAPLRCAAPRRRELLTSAHLEPDPAPAREFRLRAHTRATATAAALGSAACTFCQKAQRKRAQCQGLAHCKARGPD